MLTEDMEYTYTLEQIPEFVDVAALRRQISELRAQNEELQAERELYSQRANAQLEITRAAVTITAMPFQIYDGRAWQRGYRISTQEFEDLQRAVSAYKQCAEQAS